MSIINIVNNFNDLNTQQIIKKNNINQITRIIQLPNAVIDNENDFEQDINNDFEDDDYINNIDNMEDINKCIICQENIYDYKIEKLQCGCRNLAHKNCLIEWLKIKNKCPICRKYIVYSSNIDTIYNSNDINSSLNNSLNNSIINHINISNFNINYNRNNSSKWLGKIIVAIFILLFTFILIYPLFIKAEK